MSLINEALKRADASRPPQTPPADNTPAAPLPPPVAPVAMAYRPARPRRRASLAIILVAGVVVIGAAAGIAHLGDRLAGPKQALARVLQFASAIRGTTAPATQAPAAAMEVAVANPAASLTPEAPAPLPAGPTPAAASAVAPTDRGPAAPEAQDAGRLVEEWPAGDASYDMSATGATRAALGLPSEEAGQTLALRVRDGAMSLDADAAPPEDAASPDADADTTAFPTLVPATASTKPTAPPAGPREAPGPAKAQAAAPPATPTAPTATAAKDSAGPATFDTSKYRVSSIVVGPGGATAIVNGRPVGVGDTLGDARVVAITAWTVEVDSGGRRSTLRR